jgi:hypothetical protein
VQHRHHRTGGEGRAGMTFACVVVITATAGAAFAAGPVMAMLHMGGSVAASNP